MGQEMAVFKLEQEHDVANTLACLDKAYRGAGLNQKQ
jgi:hypothetical protein